MEKPATVLINEFRDKMQEVLNTSNLPWWKIQDELRYVIMPQVDRAVTVEAKKEMELYQESLKGDNEDELMGKDIQ